MLITAGQREKREYSQKYCHPCLYRVEAAMKHIILLDFLLLKLSLKVLVEQRSLLDTQTLEITAITHKISPMAPES